MEAMNRRSRESSKHHKSKFTDKAQEIGIIPLYYALIYISIWLASLRMEEWFSTLFQKCTQIGHDHIDDKNR